MKRSLSIFILTCISTLAATASNIYLSGSTIGSDKWVNRTFLKSETLPFSFHLDGKSSDVFLQNWKRSLKAAGEDKTGEKKYNLEMIAPDNSVKLDCEITTFADFHAAEWTIHFTNISDTNSPRISDVNVADIDFLSRSGNPDWKLYTANGTTDTDQDFHLRVFNLADTTLRFVPQGGRSSSISAFPFYNLAESDKQGVCIAIGWSGTWFADFKEVSKGKGTEFKTGMENIDLFLYPGESIRTPKVALLQWSGDNRMAGNNSLRRFLLAHHSPRFGNGESATPPLCMGFDYGDPSPCGEYESITELLGRAVVERHKNFDIMPEVFWLDAGWYEGNNAPRSNEQGRNWYTTAGSWVADSVRFPNEMKPLADAIHKEGAKLMVWFEPERVYEGTRIDNEHPEWLIYGKNGNKSRLLNLGNPDALRYICKLIGDYIESNKIDYYRQDFNINPAEFWASADPEGRKGITEIRHIENLYKFWDYLLDRFPNMLIDNCASGGRRLDLETVSRSIPLWRTDCHYGEPTCQQSHEYGLSQFLPLHGTGVYTVDPYCTRSGMSSAYCWAGEIFSRANPVREIRKTLATYKELRPFYLKDFYPLSGDGSTTGKEKWIAWQFHDPEENAGIIQAFRRDEAEADTYEVALNGIDSDSSYEIFDYDSNNTDTIKGADLMETLKIVLPQKRSSKLLRYRKVATQ